MRVLESRGTVLSGARERKRLGEGRIRPSLPGFKLDKVAGADGRAPTQPSVTLAREPCLYGGGPPKSCTVAKFQMKPKSVAWGRTSRAPDSRTHQSAPSNTLRELCATTPSAMPVVSSMYIYLYVCLFVSSLSCFANKQGKT